ncbi:MAG: fimbrillin family protein [Bacteroidaceae bacterium]|nr:fimbrillin family protein [Bacteroidaceae bacterium]
MAMTTIFGLSSCDKELFPTENTNKTFTLFATTETGTKTALSGNDTDGYQVVWSEGDEFSVFSFTTPVINCGKFTLTDGDAGKTSGTFVGEELNATKQYIAYYPATNAETILKATSTWPTNQTYRGNNITGCPMVSEIFKVSAPFVKFTNLGGILRLTVKNSENVSIKKITVCADQLESPITLDCSNGGDGVALTTDGTQFNIAMPSNDGIIEEGSSKDTLASYSNVSIYLTDMEGNICHKTLKAATLDIVRSKITNASFPVSKDKFISAGVKFTISGHEGIVVDINGDKVIVATMNVGATAVNGTGCGGSSLSFADACDSITDGTWSGWRLPTVNEIKTLCDVEYPTWGDIMEGEGNGALLWYIDDKDGIDLYLPLNDCDGDNDGNPYGKYWTGTPGENDTEKCFYFAPELIYDSGFDHDYSPVAYEDRNYGVPYKEEADKNDTYLVRLFHDLP